MTSGTKPTEFKTKIFKGDITSPQKQCNKNSIYEILSARPEYINMVKLIKLAGMKKYMDEKNSMFHTLIVAKNGAFHIPDDRGNAIRKVNANTLRGRIPPSLLKANKNMVYPTMDIYTNILVNNTDDIITLNNVKLTGQYLEADNGIILISEGLCQIQKLV